MLSKKQVSLTLGIELVEKIDEKRGLVPRSTYIESLLKKEPHKEEKKRGKERGVLK